MEDNNLCDHIVKESKYVDLGGKWNYFHIEGSFMGKANIWEVPKGVKDTADIKCNFLKSCRTWQ